MFKPKCQQTHIRISGHLNLRPIETINYGPHPIQAHSNLRPLDLEHSHLLENS